MRPPLRIPLVLRTLAVIVVAASLGALVPVASGAQETSVRPGINDAYRDPDVEQWVGRLEADDRVIFEYRHAILAALALEEGMDVADVGAGTVVDLVLLCDVYHHFEFPRPMLASLHAALREGGRLVVVDFERIEGVSDRFAIEHVRAGKGTVTDEIKDGGFDLVREIPLMTSEGQFFLEFSRR